MTPPLLDTALKLHDNGCCIVPTMTDGTKRPAGNWKTYTTTRPTRQQIKDWFTGDNYDGLGIICGTISGGLEMFEIEGRAAHMTKRLGQLMTDNGFNELWTRITTGHLEQSPSGGYHWLYRVTDTPANPNTKLARRPATPDELEHNPKEKIKVLIETRGEGGFTVTAPSAGRTHPDGGTWTAIMGGPDTIPTITGEERDALYAIAGMLDEMPTADIDQPHTTTRPADGRERPGDHYNRTATWNDILTPEGWQPVHHYGANCYGWRRPGKNWGMSATTGRNDADNLYVFTTSTEFETEKAYSKFAAYTLLNHAGDYKAAGKQLYADGYGDHTPPTINIADLITPTTDGNLATVTDLDSKRKTGGNATLTDKGNTSLFIDRHSGQLRYVPTRGKWITWDGTRWHYEEDDGAAVEAAWETIEAIDPEDDTQRKHQAKSLSRRSLEAITGLARRDSTIRLRASQLDAHPYELNTPGGIVNLTTGQTSPHDPAKLHTKLTNATPDPSQPTPLWDQFLATTFDGDPELIDFIQRLIGYAATGQVKHHILPFLHGGGGNGKSVFLDTMTGILGDYATSTPAGFLMAGRDQHDTEIARLAGMRLVVCSEVNQDSKFDEAKVKTLTGGDLITARFMRQDYFDFTPTHTLFLMGNHQPRVSAGGESFWRRLRLLPFTKQIPDKQRIDALSDRLINEEGGGIMAWIIDGAVKAEKYGLHAPSIVTSATDVYAQEEDAFARFISDNTNVGGGTLARTNTTHMRIVYAQWCKEQGEKPLSPQQFGRELRDRFNVGVARSHGKRFYTNITLLELDELDDEQWSEHWTDK